MPMPHQVSALKAATHHKAAAHKAKSAPLHRPRHRFRIAGVALAAIVGLAAAVQFGGSYVLANRVLPGVSVAGEQIGGLPPAEAARRLQAQTAAAKINLNISGTPVVLTPDQIGAKYDVQTTVDQAMAVGRTHQLVPLQLWASLHQGSQQYAFTINQAAEKSEVAKLTAANRPAKDATIVVSNGVPVVQPDQAGRGIKPDVLMAAFAAQLANPSATAITLQSQPLPATITTAEATPAVATTKQLVATPVSITYNGAAYTPTAAQIGSWITYTPNATSQGPGITPHLSSDAIKNYLKTIAPHISTAAVAKRVNVLNGVSTQTAAGQNGTALDEDTLANQIAAAVTAKTPLTTPAPTTTVPFQTIYNNTVAQPYDQYIEVDLSSQHLWAYKDHQVVYDSPVTSGATGAGFPTATGMFSIQAKETNRHLIGAQYGPRYNYDVFVQYWMPFYEGYGLHDASWRNGNFGGQDYYHGGSHGCVNLPLATAAWLYNWSSVGTPVWVHT